MTNTLITFNIGAYYPERESRYNWKFRSPIILDIIQNYPADLILLQEAQQGNLELFRNYLPDYQCEIGYPCCKKQIKYSMYNPIFWNTKKYVKINSGQFYLSKTPETWSKSWDSFHVRCATWVSLKQKDTDKKLLVYNLHLDNKSELARLNTSKLVCNRIHHQMNGGDNSVILAGDFNSRAWAPEHEKKYLYPIIQEALPPAHDVHKIYTQHGFADAFLMTGHEDSLETNTYHDYLGEAFPSVALRIDWVLIKKIIVVKYQLIKNHAGVLFPSDHYPIYIGFQIE